MKSNGWMNGLAASFCCLTLLGCGGSSDDDDTASVQTVSVGTVTGFGSVIVNGVRFDDRGATVTINDQDAMAAQLRVGMVVTVEGSVSDCLNADTALCEGIATRIRFRNNLVGPITAINRLANTMQVMGRWVVVDESSAYDGTAGADFGGLNVGDVVAVSGLTEQNRVRARLLQRLGPFVNGNTPIMLHGVVASVNAALGTCTVDGVQVRFQGLGAASLPAGGLGNDQYVQVRGKGYGSGLMTADRIQLRNRISFPDTRWVELEGTVSGFVSGASFVVDGQSVDASSAIFRNGTAADLKDGVRVEVEGTMAGPVLMARKMIFRLDASAQIVAPIQRKDAPAALLVLGQTVATTPLTRYMDHSTGSGRPNRAIGYADLLVDDRVDVRTYKDASGQWVAARIERTEPDPLLIARGAVDAKAPLTKFTLLGIDVATGVNTRYRDALGALITDVTFYALLQVTPAPQTVVRAQGVASTANTHTIDATRATSTRGEVEIAQ